MAHVTALAAARHHVLEHVGWDLVRRRAPGRTAHPRARRGGAPRHGRSCAPAISASAPRRSSRLPATGRAGCGPSCSAMRLRSGDGPTIVCAQVGNVNTGCLRSDWTAIADAVEGTGAWLHVDGAFGLWARASPRFRHLVAGAERADSWATDAHKWLNVPYDSGIAFCAHPAAHRAAMSRQASYLEQADPDAARDQLDWTPEFSRRARGFPIYAAIRALGSEGIAALVERCCDHAAPLRRAARRGARRRDPERGRAQPGARPVRRRRRADAGDRQGACRRTAPAGSRARSGRAKRRCGSRSPNWRTTEDDVERSAGAILEAAARVAGTVRAT